MQATHPITLPAGHWLGEPADEHIGLLADIRHCLPEFQRRPFGAHPRMDMIVRHDGETGEPVPIATVSKQYALIQHAEVVDALKTALTPAGEDPGGLECRLTMTESGSRMALRVTLPERFACTPPDGHRLALTYECFNSVDRSVPLFALLGWFRFVCRNGLVIGRTHARLRRYHRPPLRIEDLSPLLDDGLEAAAAEADALTASTRRPVTQAALDAWVDGPVAQAWGPFAATRVHAIATIGMDGLPSRQPRGARPHERSLVWEEPVPGAGAPCRDVYGVTQALAWVASRRNNVAEREAWRRQISDLVALV
jgi:hypothetical protein